MTLIVEDGSQVTNSNTYVSDAEYTTYATSKGLTVGSSATLREIELIKAMDYIEAHRDVFQGVKVAFDQSLQWPRFSVYIDSYPVDSDAIPVELKNAQMEAAAVLNGREILINGGHTNIQKSKLDVMEVTYFNGGSWETVRLDSVDIFLDPLLKNGSFGINANVRRA